MNTCYGVNVKVNDVCKHIIFVSFYVKLNDINVFICCMYNYNNVVAVFDKFLKMSFLDELLFNDDD